MGWTRTEALRRVGTCVAGHYVLESLLGVGGMGAVYLTHTTEGVPCAIKLVPVDVDEEPSRIDRFTREAMLVARIDHPNVVRVLESGSDDEEGLLYLVQSLARGVTLRAYLHETGVLSPAQVARLMNDVLHGLVAAHANGVIHRDVKPENVMVEVTADCVSCQLIDFGIALGQADELRVTRKSELLGTPAYMSPEQARGERDVDARTDVWSAGVLMFEMLVGRVPYQSASSVATLASLVTANPIQLSRIVPEVDVGLARVIEHALNPDRHARLESAQALIQAMAASAGFQRDTPYAQQPERATKRERTSPRRSLRSVVVWTTLLLVLLTATYGITQRAGTRQDGPFATEPVRDETHEPLVLQVEHTPPVRVLPPDVLVVRTAPRVPTTLSRNAPRRVRVTRGVRTVTVSEQTPAPAIQSVTGVNEAPVLRPPGME